MTDFEKLRFGFIFSAFGIVLGWILNQTGQWINGRKEDKKNLNLVLFNLLETYFLINRSDIKKVLSAYVNEIYKSFPEIKESEEGRLLFEDLYSSIAKELFKPDLLKESAIIVKNYQDSIATLASIDPITAYYLSGKTSVLERFEILENWADFYKLNSSEPSINNEIKETNIVDFIRPEILQDALNDLEKDIKMIAWKINLFVWFKSKRVIKNFKTKQPNTENKLITEVIEKMRRQIK